MVDILIRLDPGYVGGAEIGVLTSVAILGPPTVQEGSLTPYIGEATYSDHTIINFTNTPHFANPNAGCSSAPGATCDLGTFGAITAQAQPGGFFGPDPGNRLTWFGAKVTF